MTTIAQAVEAVYASFLASWGATTPVALDNEITDYAQGTVPWVRLTIRHTSSKQETLGALGQRQFRRDALALVQVFTPAEAAFNGGTGGRAAGDALAQQARDALEGKAINLCKMQAGNVREVHLDEVEGRWWVQLVEIPFFYFEVK